MPGIFQTKTFDFNRSVAIPPLNAVFHPPQIPGTNITLTHEQFENLKMTEECKSQNEK